MSDGTESKGDDEPSASMCQSCESLLNVLLHIKRRSGLIKHGGPRILQDRASNNTLLLTTQSAFSYLLFELAGEGVDLVVDASGSTSFVDLLISRL